MRELRSQELCGRQPCVHGAPGIASPDGVLEVGVRFFRGRRLRGSLSGPAFRDPVVPGGLLRGRQDFALVVTGDLTSGLSRI